jgi:hypothetical protein
VLPLLPPLLLPPLLLPPLLLPPRCRCVGSCMLTDAVAVAPPSHCRRLESLQSARDQRDLKELNSIRSEYHLKSEIEELGWEAAVKKADPGAVRTGLSAIKAPIPRGS